MGNTDHKSYVWVRVNGELYKMFYTSRLAKTIDREIQCTRKWICEGILPECIFFDRRNRRLFTEKQIDIIAKCCKEHGVVRGNSTWKKYSPFVADVHRRIKVHNKTYFRGNKNVEVKEE